ncbi:FtsX-like permease family protein [Amycolatopsis taiwanensis]|uniref:FtsX-like permease family protein n=1 Tax=Amycolatopsis taiwanensis TaxID=342230 RepID=UPI000483C208|nr:FtsX-like permease family protein [Amycolatopsis taiwanensis]
MNPVRFAFRVLRGDRRTRTSSLLTVVGVAVATGLVLLLASLPSAAGQRAQRSYWQEPHNLGGNAGAKTMLVDATNDLSNGDQITVVNVAPTVDPATIGLPAGVPALPGPGEVVVSPALFERMHALPAAQLADRFPDHVVGTLSDAALAYPDQLVALVGYTPDTLPGAHQMAVAGFGSAQGAHADPGLKFLAGIGMVVLLVPSLVLVASSSRLTAASRERRLAALRLAGATPGQVTGMVATETGIAAIVGALLGVAVSPLLDRLAALVPWGGGTWLPGDFRLPLVTTVLLAAGIVVLVLLAAVLGLRRVVANPVGAVSAHTPKPLRAWRLLAVPVSLAVFAYAVLDHHAGFELLLLGLAMVIGSAVVVGPWLTFAVGAIFVRAWRRPSGLLAGRRLRDDPRGAYRASAGVVLAVFVGSMALTLMPSFSGMAGAPGDGDSAISVHTETEAGPLLAPINAELARYHQTERAVLSGENEITVHTDPADHEVIRTALIRATAGQASLFSRSDYLAYQGDELTDLRRVTVIGLVTAALLAGCSVAIATAGSVLDRRRTFGPLMAAGTGVRVLSRALRAEAAIPALVATIGAGGAGVAVGLGLFAVATRGRESATAVLTPWLAAPVVLGLGVAVLAALVCTPALKRIQAEPLSDE